MKRAVLLFGGMIAALSGAVAPGNIDAQTAKSVSPDRAPADWMAYARRASEMIRGAIESDAPEAARFRASLDSAGQGSPKADAPLALKLWIDGQGMITRVEFTPFGDAPANADLTALLTNRRVGSAPPKGMLLPLRLSIALRPAQPDDPSSHEGKSRP